MSTSRLLDDGDVEAASPSSAPQSPVESDWHKIALLAQHKKSSRELEHLLIGTTGSRRGAVRSYYEQQNELIDGLLETAHIHRGQYTNDRDEEDAQVSRALNLSFASNCLLLAVRLGIAVISGSLSLLIATMDAVLDVISSAMLYYTSWQSKKENKYLYPVGKERMEPLGVVVFSVVMATACLSVVMESIKALLSPPEAEDLPAKMVWVVVGGTVGVVTMKLALFLYCRGSANPAVRAFALDHLNDVLVNSAGLAGALLGQKVAPYWDPIVAIAISCWVVWAWGGQAREHVLNLVGLSAPPELLQKLTYLTYYHDPRVRLIDTVRAYSYGSTFIAEVDIVLPPDMRLQEAHDIGESLQHKLEMLPEVARAHVHLDYEALHAPEH